MGILKSILILSSVSAAIGGLLYLLGLAFWPVFGLAVLFQIFVYNLFMIWVKQQSVVQFEKLHNERIKEFNSMGLDSVCPDENRGHKAFVPIKLDQENVYECPGCKKMVKVLIGAKSFLTTTPLEEDPFKNFNFAEGKEYDN